MKTIFTSLGIFISALGISQVSDSVILGTGYTNESYYSLENGEVANVDNTNWDIAFDLSGYGATIKLNGKQTTLYVYPGASADWSSLDTAGMTGWDTYLDTYNSWSEGAFNNCADATNPSDLGWGLYNTITHFINGEKLFVVELDNGDFKKLFIEELASGTYTFKYADIDGNNEVNETVLKSDYSGQNFIHYSIENEAIVDREPLSAEWDIVFTNVLEELIPGYFMGVTNVFHNNNVEVSEVSGIPVANATYGTFESEINTIGSDWKTYNMPTWSYEIEDSLSYFVETEVGDIWKLVFTGFNGTSDGKIFFTKEKIAAASITQNNTINMTVYPNPANHGVTIQPRDESIQSINLFNISGQLIYSQNFENEFEVVEISTEDIENGVYLLNITTKENKLDSRKLVIQH